MNDDKSRSKALKISVCVSGVESAALTGEGKNQVEVVGEGIDAVELTRRLRKNVAYAELVSVAEVKKEGAPAAKVVTPNPQPTVVWTYAPPYDGFPQYPVYETSFGITKHPEGHYDAQHFQRRCYEELLDAEGGWNEELTRSVFQPINVEIIVGLQELLEARISYVGTMRRKSVTLLRVHTVFSSMGLFLQKRGMSTTGACPYCGTELEDLLHMLLRSHFPRLVWALSHLPWTVISNVQSDPEAWFRGLYPSLDAIEFNRALLIS
ncbi:UNVERIFIED_CONTAM: Disease resistance protein Pik-1 [Sesamum calycinum]|uniref:Disease resistance protein Pik-1 n=1 Tax=Sesamum calycinum TaxID=2727403 RepID=A0AAW2Q466_9LAMI